jgi:hypothetical protein
MNDIKTKDKKEFLSAEMIYYDKYPEGTKNSVINLATPCKSCGVYYWQGCKKRCNCFDD